MDMTSVPNCCPAGLFPRTAGDVPPEIVKASSLDIKFCPVFVWHVGFNPGHQPDIFLPSLLHATHMNTSNDLYTLHDDEHNRRTREFTNLVNLLLTACCQTVCSLTQRLPTHTLEGS